MNLMVAVLLPCAVVIVVGTLRVSAMEIHHGLLGLWSSRYISSILVQITAYICRSGFNELITECLKNRVGMCRRSRLERGGKPTYLSKAGFALIS